MDQNFLYRQTSPTTPLLVMYTMEKDAAEKCLYKCVHNRQQDYKAIMLSGSGAGEERMARKNIQEAMTEVYLGVFMFVYCFTLNVNNAMQINSANFGISVN